MAVEEHKDYQHEKKRLEATIDYVEHSISTFDDNKERLQKDITEAFIELDFLDSSMSYVKILTSTRFLDSLEKNYHGFKGARKKPYFSRIDFKADDCMKISQLYIGKISIPKIEEDEPLIVDWRSPIASVYYDGMPGPVTYNAPSGVISGELSLKRQYTIKEGILENIMDVDITANDTFLQAALGENKDNKLRDIVSTIQAEQNEVIRADIGFPLIIQGVAGSGKTTIALHRIAYLIYTYENTFDPENFMIIAPNRLFLNYISEVLPELGVEQVKQTTFVDLFYDLTGVSYKLINQDQKLIRFMGNDGNCVKSKKTKKEMGEQEEKQTKQGKELKHIRDLSKFKGSLQFRDTINRFINHIEESFIPNIDFAVEGYTLFTSNEIRKMFLKDFVMQPLYKRLEGIKKIFSDKLKREKAKIIEKIEYHYDSQIERIRFAMLQTEERRKKVVPLIDERDLKIETLKKKSKTAVAKYLAHLPKLSLLDYYEELMTKFENLKMLGEEDWDDEFVSYICDHSKGNLIDKKSIEFEDLAALIYMKLKIFGFSKAQSIKYVVVDEAQDFSLFQIYALKQAFDTRMFTLLGDLAQGIHSYRGIGQWTDLLEEVFEGCRGKILTLEQSYRTTIEIMNMANKVLKIAAIPGIVLAKPVVRHGAKPQIYKFDEEKTLIDDLKKKIVDCQKCDFNTVAIICKTTDECKIVQKALENKSIKKIKLLSAEDSRYEGGTLIVPTYLAKGLEFDAVIIVSINEDFYEKELDLKLLYISMTRALHKVDIMCLRDKMRILDK